MSMSRLCNYLGHSILYSHKKCIKVCSPEFTSTQYSQRFTLFQPDECDMVDDRVMFGKSLNLLSSLYFLICEMDIILVTSQDTV